MAVISKKLVIDASVARASGGEDASHPVAMAARDFLQAVLTICHKAVLTPPMQGEWNKHQSRFALAWRRSMVARKKLIVFKPGEHDAVRGAVGDLDVSASDKQAMLKDCHLIEAALSMDSSVISLDDAAGSLFFEASGNIPELRGILWVNPVNSCKESLKWLEDGAPSDGEGVQLWRLGSNC
jgi:hypothetical protein